MITLSDAPGAKRPRHRQKQADRKGQMRCRAGCLRAEGLARQWPSLPDDEQLAAVFEVERSPGQNQVPLTRPYADRIKQFGGYDELNR
jgi:hypothetical protein